MGNIRFQKGISVNPMKVEAINNFRTPTNKTELQKLLGMITYLDKCIPNMSDLTETLRKLLRKNIKFRWDCEQNEALVKLKKHSSYPPVLKFYDVDKYVTLTEDPSSRRFGAALLQSGQPMSYATKSLTKA